MVIAGLVAAAVLELIGLVLAAVGFKRTWREHAHAKDFWLPLKRDVARAVRHIARAMRKVLRRPGQPVNVDVHPATIRSEARIFTPTITSAWPPLPNPADDGPAFATEVHERLNQLHSLIQGDQRALAKEQNTREDEDAKLRTELTELGTVVDAKTANVAVGGLRLQVLGWSFLLVGIVVGAIVNVVDRVAQG